MNQKEREAMQLALKAFDVATTHFAKDRQEILRAKEALRAALAEPEVDDVLEQEVFVWYDDATGETWTPGFVQDFGFPVGLRPLYSAPSSREWVGLTDEELSAAWASSKGDVLFRLLPFARAIEATLKEKNHG